MTPLRFVATFFELQPSNNPDPNAFVDGFVTGILTVLVVVAVGAWWGRRR